MMDVALEVHKAGAKLTKTRSAVYSVLRRNAGSHLTCEEIYQSVKAELPSIGMATVYRSIHLFEEIGVVAKVLFADGITRYELSSKDNRHYHLYCESCGRIIEISQSESGILEGYPNNFHLSGNGNCLYGLCDECYTGLYDSRLCSLG